MPRLPVLPLLGPSASSRLLLHHDLVGLLRGLPGASQQVSRRNAMLACTDLAARRAEREDVEELLRDLTLHAAAHS